MISIMSICMLEIQVKKSVMNDKSILMYQIYQIKRNGILITGLPHDSDYSEQALKT